MKPSRTAQLPRLLVVDGDQVGEEHVLQKPVTRIGRAADCEVRLTGGQISRHHAQIDLDRADDGSATVVVRDLESKNGVLINGVRTPRHTLHAGDEIQIGTCVLAFDPPYEVRRAEDSERTVVIFHGEDGAATASIAAQISATDAQRAISPKGRPAGDERDEVYRRLDTMYRVSQLIAAILDPKELCAMVVDVVSSLLHADRCLVLLTRHGERVPAPVASHVPQASGPASVSQTVIRRVVESRRGVLAINTKEDDLFGASVSLTQSRVYALMCVPLAVEDRVLGVLYADTMNPLREFTTDDIALMTAIGAQVAIALNNATRFARTQQEARALRARLDEEAPIIGAHGALEALLADVAKIAPTDSTVLIRGETGTGKELIARALHQQSPRAEGPCISINCAAMTETLLESELFGHEKGAFTGAHKTKLGKFELANGGTLFLDEVGELSQATQTKLLRVLEERKIDRVGGTRLIPVDVRIVSATNRELEAEVKSGRFREDLYYRISVVPLTIPPLRERKPDIPALVEHFLHKFNRQVGRKIRGVTDAALEALTAYAWPGNVRELQNTIERIVVLTTKDLIELDDLPAPLRSGAPSGRFGLTIDEERLSLPEAIATLERRFIEAALARAKGKKIEAARLLHISRPTLDKKIRDYDIPMP